MQILRRPTKPSGSAQMPERLSQTRFHVPSQGYAEMREMRRTRCAALLVLVACGEDGGNDGGSSAILPTVTEFASDQPIGPQRSIAWTADSVADIFELSTDDGYFEHGGLDIRKWSNAPRDSSPQLWSYAIEDFGSDAPGIHATDGGGLVLTGDDIDQDAEIVHIRRIGPDGSELARHQVMDMAMGANTLLPSGTVVFVFTRTPRAGSLDEPSSGIVAIDANGVEAWRTQIPSIHLPEYDRPGLPDGDLLPGIGTPDIVALTPTNDGGVYASGSYSFRRSIQCGTQTDPQDPTTASCASVVHNNLVLKIDATGALLWARHLGRAYLGGTIRGHRVSTLADGSALVTGYYVPEREGVRPQHMQGFAARYTASGELAWAKSFPFGRAPGGDYFDLDTFDKGAPQADDPPT